jgi:hypothetical protein
MVIRNIKPTKILAHFLIAEYSICVQKRSFGADVFLPNKKHVAGGVISRGKLFNIKP